MKIKSILLYIFSSAFHTHFINLKHQDTIFILCWRPFTIYSLICTVEFFRNVECGHLYPFRDYYPSRALAQFVNIVENLPQFLIGPSDYIVLFMTFDRFAKVCLMIFSFSGWRWWQLFLLQKIDINWEDSLNLFVLVMQ